MAFFKPRIFISSLLKNRIKLRESIEKILTSAGAEVLLYEKILTPSVNLNAYRTNVKDADFIIMILDENYGTKTKTGRSGVEEEYIIATENRIKTHIYLKNSKIKKWFRSKLGGTFLAVLRTFSAYT